MPQNLIANFLGKGVVAVSGLAFIPLYMRFFGLDGFAVVALIPAFSSLAMILDMGITPSVNRELARLSAVPGTGPQMRDLVRSFEFVVWIMAIVLGLLGAILIYPMIGHWAGMSNFSSKTLHNAALCLALNLALQWPTGLYAGALVGLQRQVALSAIFGGMALLRNGGVVLVLWLISPTVEAFMVWQILISVALTLTVAFYLWRSLPPSHRRPRADIGLIKKMWRMAAGMSGASISSLFSTQIDKIILSQVLSLEMFGYYMLGYTIASKVSLVNAPIIEAVFPRMTQLADGEHFSALRNIYRRTIQFAGGAFLPAAAVFVFFGKDIMTVWTLDPQLGQESGLLTGVLVVGFAASALMDVSMVLDWARGRTKIAFWARLISCLALVPALIVGGSKIGALGGAIAWAGVQVAVLLIAVPLIHRTWPKSYAKSWYMKSLLRPFAVSLLVAGLCALPEFPNMSFVGQLAIVACVTLTAYVAAAFTTPITQDIMTRLAEQQERRRVRMSS